MARSYYQAYVLPNDPDAKEEDTEYYQFLCRAKDTVKNSTAFLVAWKIDASSGEWELPVTNVDFHFTHSIELLVYRFKADIFISVEESVEENIFSIDLLTSSFEQMDEFIGYQYWAKQ